MPPRTTRGSNLNTTPDDVVVTPQKGTLSALDHSFNLQMVREIQTTIGQLGERIDARANDLSRIEQRFEKDQEKLEQLIAEDYEKLEKKAEESRAAISDLKSDIRTAKVIAGLAGGFVTLAITVVGVIALPVLFKILDVLVKIFVLQNPSH